MRHRVSYGGSNVQCANKVYTHATLDSCSGNKMAGILGQFFGGFLTDPVLV